jgi:hypothetical protein
MASLDDFPCRLLLRAVLLLLGRQPSDRRGIKEDLCSGHSRETRGLGVPLIPADQHADAAEAGVPGAKAQVSGSEVELLVVLRVVGDVHLPILPEEPAVGVDDGRGVVIQAFGALLEQRGDDHHPELTSELTQLGRRRSGNGLSQPKELVILSLAKISAAEKLLETNDLRAATSSLADALHGLGHVRRRVRSTTHLHQTERDAVGSGGRCHTRIIIAQQGESRRKA